jgi:acyl transferase domain-containing protein
MFSGQGSQYYRMGLDLYGAEPVFRATMDRCSERVSRAIGASLTGLLFQARADRFAPFDRTLYTHPALFAIQYSLAETLRSRGHHPDAIVGYSLGEWVGDAVAGRVAAESILDVLVAQAQRVEAVCPRGGMLAVLRPAEMVDEHPEWFRDTWVVARNFERHFVVSGLEAPILAVEQRLKAENITAQRLPVSHPFHTPLMDAMESDCVGPLRPLTFQPGTTRLFSSRGEEVTHAQPVETLWRALREPVSFAKVVRALEAEGAPTYIDCGPAGPLANFVKYNLPKEHSARCVPLMTPFDRNVERLNALGTALAAAGVRA